MLLQPGPLITGGGGKVLMIPLKKSSLNLLLNCLKYHAPELIPIVNAPDKHKYTADFYNELRNNVGNELCDKGFDTNFEPNAYGISLESLIDEIGQLFMPLPSNESVKKIIDSWDPVGLISKLPSNIYDAEISAIVGSFMCVKDVESFAKKIYSIFVSAYGNKLVSFGECDCTNIALKIWDEMYYALDDI